jgi:Tfp pilus assembly protein PilE
MTNDLQDSLKRVKFFKRFSMIEMMLVVATAGIVLTLIANYFQL